MRECLVVGVLVAIILLIPPVVVLAESSDDVTVTGTGFASPLTVETYNAGVIGSDVTMNGDITATGGAWDCDVRGFVWDTVTHGAPGNVAPDASGYAFNWTEAGAFNVGAFDYEIAGLTELTTYYYRACAHCTDGWGYGEELTFFVGEEGKIYFEIRPDLDETKIRGQAGVPSDFAVGGFNGYSLPIYAEDFEQLNYIVCVPSRWDEESDILLHIDCALTVANEADRAYRWELLWEHFTPNEDIVPATSNEVNYTRYIYSNAQYQSYQDWMVIDYDIDVGDSIVHDDLIAIIVRRETVAPQLTDSNEIVVFAIDILFARGDLLGDPGDVITEGGIGMVLLALIFLPLGLTIVMFVTRQMMLGFPCAIFWAILGGYAYTLSEATWDIYYLLFFASAFGMVIFTILAAFGLRERRDTYAEEELEKGEGEYVDEGKEETGYTNEAEGEPKMSKHTKGIRARAKERREKPSGRSRL